MNSLGFGIVGCGGAALDVAAALDSLADARVVATFDVSPERATQIAASRDATVHDSLAALLADDRVDVVYVALPHDLLADTSSRALSAGRHVLVEKPSAISAASAAEVTRLADRLGRVLGVMFEFRASPPIIEARRLLAAGDLGAVVGVRIRTVIDKPADYWWSGPSGRVVDNWRASRARAGGGVVFMNSIHQLDALRYVTGTEIVRASAEVATISAGVEVEDTAGAVLRLAQGAVAVLAAAAHSPGATAEEVLSIDCAHGRLDLPDPYGTGRLRVFSRIGPHAGKWVEMGDAARPSHAAFLHAFIAAVRDQGRPPATGWDAAIALSTVEAIYESARIGRAVDISTYGP
jgi:UDP-N-acetyl-2-amino-2-deoxyglucuronate dehydrogenase